MKAYAGRLGWMTGRPVVRVPALGARPVPGGERRRVVEEEETRGCRIRGRAPALRSAPPAASPGSGTASADAPRDGERLLASHGGFQSQGQATVLPDQSVASSLGRT